jgi:hypothetical protein
MVRQGLTVLAVTLLVVGAVAPASGTTVGESTNGATMTTADADHALAVFGDDVVDDSEEGENETEDDSGDDSVIRPGAGRQLSTVLAVTVDETRTEFESRAFALEFDREGDPAVLAERAETLQNRSDAIQAEYANATAAYRAGNLSGAAYAERLATLNARARNVLESHEDLSERAATVPEAELEASGFDEAALDAAVQDLESVTGAGPGALLAQFTGTSRGEIELDARSGLSIEAESEDGERSREVRRPGDDSLAFTVDQSAALRTARGNLSTQAANWSLQESSVHPEDGTYRFEFSLLSAEETGEAEARVDGSSAELVRLEEEIERRDDGDEDEEDDDLRLHVIDGMAAANNTVTVEVRQGVEVVPDATVRLNEHVVGTTDADGRITLDLPADRARIEADAGDADGELRFRFEDDDDDHEREDDDDDTTDEAEVDDDTDDDDGTADDTSGADDADDGTAAGPSLLDATVDATLDDETVTVTVSADGTPVTDVLVEANGRDVGRTDGDGRVSFDVDADVEDLELELESDDEERDRVYVVEDGALVRNEDEE